MSPDDGGKGAGLFRRLSSAPEASLSFTLNGRPVKARAGDTVLTAILTQAGGVRDFEFGDQSRAGFCLIGACQDCWVKQSGGGSLRACTTLLVEGMSFDIGAAGR